MSVRLLDVNVLIALLDSAHQHHQLAVKWFRGTALEQGWATTAITENGFIRIISSVSYGNLNATPGFAAETLGAFKSNFREMHQFWTSEISLTHSDVFDLSVLTGSRQTTDLYLAGLAFRHGGKLTTLDRNIPWRAIRGADATLVDTIVP